MKTNPRILVTGSTGLLGRSICETLTDLKIQYKKGVRDISLLDNQSVVMDLTSEHDIDVALSEIDVVIHAASDKKNPDNDVTGIAKLIDAIKRTKRSIHLVYISIVGTDEIAMTYFRQKAKAEKLIESAGLSYSILRSTQFHEFVAEVVYKLSIVPFITLIPKNLIIQPIDVKMVSKMLVEISLGNPTNQTESVGGPDIFELEKAIKSLLQLQDKSRIYIHIPLWGKLGKSLESGKLTTPNKLQNGITWQNWLNNRDKHI